MSHIKLLKTSDLKATPQRLCVLDTLENCGHATLEQIEKITKEKFPTLSLSTIYRNLNEMVEKDIISEVKIAKKPHYEIKKEKHIHLYCKSCDTIWDFQSDTNAFIDKIENEANCKILNDVIHFEILCTNCLK
ncbi:MAG: transcriptional repressor [Sulfurospirillum sp.]|nr:transcriptional repressor [Sulfurospirillum sp.]